MFSLCGMAQVNIKMEKDGGVYKVPCTVNGAKMKFIFDTGAASVSLSKTMADYLFDNKYLLTSDITGTKKFQDATGRITTKKIVNIKDIELGGLHINNVEASISESQDAPLLLGQSVIEKLGKVTISSGELVINSYDCTNELNPTSFLGIKFGLSRDDVWTLLKSRYGNSVSYIDKYTDGVYEVTISTVTFDIAYFEFDKNDKLVSASVHKDYNINQLNKAKADRDKLALIYKKKYPDLYDIILEDGFKNYYGGGSYYSENSGKEFNCIQINVLKTTDDNDKPCYHLSVAYYSDRAVNQNSSDDI